MAEASRKHPHLTEEELAEFREIFNLVDLDKGGTISKEELKHWLLPRPGVSGRRRRALCVALLNVPPPRAPSPRAFRLCAARR